MVRRRGLGDRDVLERDRVMERVVKRLPSSDPFGGRRNDRDSVPFNRRMKLRPSWPRWFRWQGPTGLAMTAAVFMVVAATIFALAGYRPSRSAVTVSGSPSATSITLSPTPAAASPALSVPPTATSVANTPAVLPAPFADCSMSPGAGATMTEPLGDYFRTVVGVPNGWTRQAVGATETKLLVIAAPGSYKHQPTTIEVLSLIGYFANQSPRDLAPIFYGASVHPDIPSVVLVGAVSDCRVQGLPAAAFQYVQGDRGGYLVLFLYDNYLYGVRVEGVRGVDPLAIRDAKQVLGSIARTLTTPPAR